MKRLLLVGLVASGLGFLFLQRSAGIAANVLATGNINPRDFSTTIDNPFFPLVPNTTFIYVGTKEGSTERDEFAVTGRTKVLARVTCREVHDQVFVDGVLAEDTLDWFAQDTQGNVCTLVRTQRNWMPTGT